MGLLAERIFDLRSYRLKKRISVRSNNGLNCLVTMTDRDILKIRRYCSRSNSECLGSNFKCQEL